MKITNKTINKLYSSITNLFIFIIIVFVLLVYLLIKKNNNYYIETEGIENIDNFDKNN